MPKRGCADTDATSLPGTCTAARGRKRICLRSDTTCTSATQDNVVVVAAIADTHGVLDNTMLDQLQEAAPMHVLHMGDIGDPRKSRLSGAVLLKRLSTSLGSGVKAVAGNVDEPDHDLMATLPYFVLTEIAGWRLLLVHGHADGLRVNAHGIMDKGLLARVAEMDADIILFGHSHKPLVARQAATGRPPSQLFPLETDQKMWLLHRDVVCAPATPKSRFLVNPGSAGPRRFRLPRCWFLMRVQTNSIEIERKDFG